MQKQNFSRAGYWPAPDSPRSVTCFNSDWLFRHAGDAAWERVSLPHSIDPPMFEASGCVNRQGPASYIKRFKWSQTRARAFLHFEGVMGKSRFFVNGVKAAEHFGGYLPVHFEITELLRDGGNEVRVECDNSDDPTYPPGKPQRDLDFCYFGGIYRDCWLVETDGATIGEPSQGGISIVTERIGDGMWRLDVAERDGLAADLRFFYEGREVPGTFTVERPLEWTPDEPNLHFIEVRAYEGERVTDAVRVRFGFRDARISSAGLVLNGKPWRKLVGVNRHQDFAYLGNALANSLHWRDAKKYRDAGFTIIRAAHYPQDPAFMDACDELGLFVIIPTPGWQFWNGEDPVFEERILADIRAIARRDGSRPSVLFYEPILNETKYPASFAGKALAAVKEETGGRGICACDSWSEGAESFDIIYHNQTVPIPFELKPTQARFVREWGDCVDDWSAQNSPSRVAREWGEGPMIIQAEHYLHGTGGRICLDTILASPPDMLGGCIWHGADHARGYHPDNFLGGVITYDRRPKYSYYALKCALSEEPCLFVANALAPYSPQPVTIYSNRRYKAEWMGEPFEGGMPHDTAKINRLNNDAFYGEGYPMEKLTLSIETEDGEKSEWRWARRLARLELALDTCGLEIAEDGDDMVVAVATLCDEQGTPRRYACEEIVFEANGCDIIGPTRQRTRFGEATVILRTHGVPFKVRASLARRGLHVDICAELCAGARRGSGGAASRRARV